jgi:hypothetical protein
MANDFDLPPVYDPVTKLKPDYLSAVWSNYLATFVDTLKDYLSQYGVLLPEITTAQRDSIQSPRNGQTIYNVTTDTAEYYQVSSGTWIAY